jgi:predicted Zn-dependent protease
VFEILLREASVRIAGVPPVEEAFDRAHRGLLYSRLGDSSRAEAQWQQAVNTLPREPILWLIRARQLVEQKRPQEAEAALGRMEGFAPDTPELWKERGRLYSELGRADKAATDFRKAQLLIDGKKSEPSK